MVQDRTKRTVFPVRETMRFAFLYERYPPLLVLGTAGTTCVLDMVLSMAPMPYLVYR